MQSGKLRRIRTRVIAAFVVLAIGAAGYLFLSAKKAAPDVAFTSLNGDMVRMQDLRGKVVIVNFWATSCAVCIKEMPQMVQTFNKYKGQGLDLIAVAMHYDPPNYVLNYAQTRQLPFTVALDPQGDIAQAFDDVQLTPTTYVIDRNGIVIKRYLGEPDFAPFHRLLEQALAA